MSTTVRHAFGDMSSAGTGKFAAALFTSTPGQPELGLRGVERGRDLLGVADVARDREHRRADRLDRLPARVEVLGLAARDHDRRAEARELGRDRLAEPGAAAGDEHATRRRRCPAGSAVAPTGGGCGQSDQSRLIVRPQLPV